MRLLFAGAVLHNCPPIASLECAVRPGLMPTRPDRFPILQARPAHDLINRVTHAQKELAAIQLSRDQKQDLDRWVDAGFASAALGLEGIAVSREKVEGVMAGSAPAAAAAPEDKSGIASVLDAISAIRSLAAENGLAASLTPALLITLHSSSDEHELSHKESGGAQSPLDAVAASRFAKLGSACHWFAAESFEELHPAEQAAIVLMRLIELKPFEEGNTRTALAASSLFTLRSGLPPIIMGSSLHAAYRAALNEGMKMNTKPMVDLVAQALVITVGEIVERVRSQ